MHYLYRITDTLNNKIYIGQSNKETERWRQHKYRARQEKPIQYINRAMKKYGAEYFLYAIIAMCRTQEDADETEKQLIIQYDSRNKEYGYNLAPGGNVIWPAGTPAYMFPRYGKHNTEEWKRHMSKIMKGRKNPHSKEWSEKVSATLTGHIVTEETRQKISAGKIGQHYSEDAKKKMSESQIGRKHSVETKKKMSEASFGKKKSEKTKANMSKAQRRYSPEQEKEIVRLFNSGVYKIELSRIYACNRATIYNIIKRNAHP